MELHIRVYNAANLEAMRCLTKTAYMVLQYLVCRADGLGRCFPSAATIAKETGTHEDVVYKTLQVLEDEKYIGYLRRNSQDPITGRFLPNVYIVSPFFICLAAENQENAEKLWLSVYPNFVPTFRHFIGTNQQQEPAPETSTSYPAPETNNNNQHFRESGEAGQAPQNQNSPSGKSKKAKSEKPKSKSESQNAETAENQQGEAPQQSKKRGRSAANYNPNYKNPDPIPAPIPDEVLERLANRVNGLGVPIPLARGFVMAYGGVLVETALLQVAAAKRHGQDFKNEAGFFRHILQNNLVDSSLPEALKPKVDNPFYGLQWSDFSE